MCNYCYVFSFSFIISTFSNFSKYYLKILLQLLILLSITQHIPISLFLCIYGVLLLWLYHQLIFFSQMFCIALLLGNLLNRFFHIPLILGNILENLNSIAATRMLDFSSVLPMLLVFFSICQHVSMHSILKLLRFIFRALIASK